MPRTVDPNKHILHPSYQWAYLLTRGKTFYSVIHSNERSTGIKAEPENIPLAMEILDQRLQEYLKPNKSRTIEDAAKEFLELKLNQLPRGEVSNYLHILGMYLDGIALVSDTNVIRSRVYQLIRSNKESEQIVNKQIEKIREFFVFCIEKGYCDKNPVSVFMLPNQNGKEEKHFTEDEIYAIINQLRKGESYRLYSKEHEELILLIRLISTAGLRINEALLLKKSDIEPLGLKIENNESENNPKTRYIPYLLLPELESICKILKTYNEGEKAFSWNSRKNPAENFKAAMSLLGMDTNGRSMLSLRKSALLTWEIKYGFTKELRSRLAGYSDSEDGYVYLDDEF